MIQNGSQPRLVAVSAAAFLAALVRAESGTLQMSWITADLFHSFTPRGESILSPTLGPDGPWQAVVVTVGRLTGRLSYPGALAIFWPSVFGTILVPTESAGGYYDPWNSSSAVASGLNWKGTPYMGTYSATGSGYSDLITIQDPGGFKVASANATVFATSDNSIILPNSTKYQSPIGVLGLGVSSALDQPPIQHVSLLAQLKSSNQIVSNSFGMHIGSPAMNQTGSLVLGGYEQNRALGRLGVFDLRDSGDNPIVLLIDVLLGVQTGASPFNNLTNATSIYQGPGLLPSEEAEEIGGKHGSALVTIGAELPYIYLPAGTCEAAAAFLPVTWDDNLGLYLWNTNDAQFSRIVSSPAYLGFVLSDRRAINVTVKVPFPLLNLNLTAPLADTPTPYFPCKPQSASEDTYVAHLGRAFLQAAFLGVNYDKNISFIAQAPGPYMDQSVVQTLGPADTTMQTNDIATFEQTWSGFWTPLADSPAAPPEPSGLSAGTIAGAAVGTVAGVGIAIGAAFLLWRKSKPRSGRGTLDPIDESFFPEVGRPMPHEMESSHGVSEAPAYELPATR